MSTLVLIKDLFLKVIFPVSGIIIGYIIFYALIFVIIEKRRRKLFDRESEEFTRTKIMDNDDYENKIIEVRKMYSRIKLIAKIIYNIIAIIMWIFIFYFFGDTTKELFKIWINS